MAETKTYELFLVVDAEGEGVVVFDDAETAMEAYQEDFSCGVRRTVKINVTLTLPEFQEASVTVPDEAGQTVEVKS